MSRDTSNGTLHAPLSCDTFTCNDHSRTPVVVCGPGSNNPHAPDEYVVEADLHALARAYVALALDWCGGALT